ncbi:MAG TPA: hypothetical protein VGI57_04500, partial [Usitatibacter sp.]
MLRPFACIAVLLALAALPVAAQLNEESGKQVAQEVKLLVTEGTAVIGDLQPAINGGKVEKDKATPDALVAQFKARDQKASGAPLDTNAKGVLGDVRRAYLQAFTAVVTRFQPNIVKGGQDAFVPAFFRAQVLKDFNQLTP